MLAAVIAWACSTQSPTAATQATQAVNAAAARQINTDVATSIAPDVASEAEEFVIGEAMSFGPIFGIPVPGGSGNVRPAAAACSPRSRSDTLTFGREAIPDTIAFSRTWEFFSASGCQPSFDTASTDSIVFTSSLYEVDHDSMFFHRASANRSYSVSGTPTLHADTVHVWNGASMSSDTSSRVDSADSHSRSFSGTTADTATGVTLPNPIRLLSGAGWGRGQGGDLNALAIVPSAGTLSLWTNWMRVKSDSGTVKDTTVDKHVVVTFNGTTQVPLLIYDGATNTLQMTCTLDLVRRRIVAGSCH
jgi:hypothetical protein